MYFDFSETKRRMLTNVNNGVKEIGKDDAAGEVHAFDFRSITWGKNIEMLINCWSDVRHTVVFSLSFKVDPKSGLVENMACALSRI